MKTIESNAVMEVNVMNEAGYEEAMFGLAQNKKQDPEKMPKVASHLNKKHRQSESKFLRQMWVAMTIRTKRSVWQEFDTYMVGVVKQSESTMNSIMKGFLDPDKDFATPPPIEFVEYLNRLIKEKNLRTLKDMLPEGFLQKRVVTLNYQVLRNIILDRRDHRLPEWRMFIKKLMEQVEHPEFLAPMLVLEWQPEISEKRRKDVLENWILSERARFHINAMG